MTGKYIIRVVTQFTLALALTGSLAEAQTILFVRGADRSGGATEGSGVSDPFNIRGFTEQLGDIRDPAGPVFDNNPTGNGNHSWFELANLLVNNGYTVEQTTESVEADAGSTGPTEGAPVAFDSSFVTSTFADLNANNGVTQTRSLSDFDAVVFGSNNAVYTQDQIDAVSDYLRDGGGALFISDANFGSERGDAQRSDQQFLDPFGIQVNEDRGTYQVNRGDGAAGFEEFRDPDSPLLAGVDTFDGEGVSPFTFPANLSDLPSDVTAQIVAGVPAGQSVREPGNNTRSATPNDAALFSAEVGFGRIVGHFDRNTFFNLNGAGSDIRNFDNTQLALNIIEYASSAPGPLLGDFDRDGDVDADDVDFYLGAIGLPAIDMLEQLDLNGDELVTLADHQFHVENLVQTSNGQTGTFLGDLDLNGVVDVLGDGFTLISNLGSTGPFGYANGNLNADFAIDVLGDAFLFIANLGNSN